MINDFIKMVTDLGVNINDDILEKLHIYYSFLLEYNNKTNITSITEERDVYFKHFYDSITIIKAINLNEIESILDIGTGAGFPGMVLKIFFPHLKITLLDSNNKKVTFLIQLSEKLDIDIEIINDRAEEYYQKFHKRYDLVVSRSVAYIDIITSLSLPFLNESGKVILMKGDIDSELKLLECHQNDLNIQSYEIINVNYMDNIRNLIILTRKNAQFKILTYAQLLKRNKKWK